MEDVLEKVRDFADRAHGEQTRKYTPDRYIVHPVRVMETCRRYTGRLPVLAAALLHDVLEDTPVGREALQDFLLQVMNREDALETIRLVVELTDVFVRPAYPRWPRKKRRSLEAERLGKVSADAQTVKYADIIDNSHEIVDHDRLFAPVYLRESKEILEKMTKGDPQLYSLALAQIDHRLSLLSGHGPAALPS